MNTKSYDYYAYSRVVVLSRGGRKILKQANPYIKPANERAFPRCATRKRAFPRRAFRGDARFRVCSNRASRAKNKASKAFLNFIKRSSEFHALNEDPQASHPLSGLQMNARFRAAPNAETRVSAFVLIAPVAPKIKPAYTLEYIVLGISCTK